MNTAGTTEIYLFRDTVGIPYRIEVQFAGDSSSAAATSSWVYFRFTS